MITIMRRFSVQVGQAAADEYDLVADQPYQVLAIKDDGQTQVLIAADDEFLWLNLDGCYIGNVE